MKTRLRKVIDYATHGRPVAFAEQMGWSTQYLNNLLNTEAGIGIRPVMTILEKLPEVDARWLLFGTGTMLSDFTCVTREYMWQLLAIERETDDMDAAALTRMTSEITTSLARLQGYLAALQQGKSAKKAQGQK